MTILNAEPYVIKPSPVMAVYITPDNFLTVVNSLRDSGYVTTVELDDSERVYHASISGAALAGHQIVFNDGEYLVFNSDDQPVESLSSSDFERKYQKA